MPWVFQATLTKLSHYLLLLRSVFSAQRHALIKEHFHFGWTGLCVKVLQRFSGPEHLFLVVRLRKLSRQSLIQGLPRRYIADVKERSTC